ncbi:MAG: molybdenum cofactor guanylyltransferase MobA [Rubricella sp.]
MTPPAVVLAGGAGLRMGGVDKALLPFGGATLLDAVLGRLAPQAGPIAVSANGDPGRFARFGLPVLADPLPGAGPLAGVLSAMRWARAAEAPIVVTVSVDTPFLPRRFVQALRLAQVAAGSPVVLAETGGAARRLHPTCGLWSTALADRLAADLDGGARKLGLWAETQGATRVSFDVAPGRPDPFFNLNTPDDMARAERMR